MSEGFCGCIQNICNSIEYKGGVNSLGIQVVKKEELKVVGICWNGTYLQTETIPGLFSEMERRLNEISYKTADPVIIAPFHSRETEFTYYVTTPVEQIHQVPNGMVGFTIPRKNYVVTSHFGPADEVEDTYQRLFTWMKEYGYEQDHQALSLEIYQQHSHGQDLSKNLLFEIYIPVKTYN